MDWYVLQVLSGKEAAVAAELIKAGTIPLTPMAEVQERRDGRLRTVIKCFLPGYVLVRTELDPERYYGIKTIPNVIRFLGMTAGEGRPAVVPEHEMRPWLVLSPDGQRPVGISTGIKINGRTHILDGPLATLEDRIRAVDARQRRATIDLEILGLHHLVTLGVNIISSQGSAADDSSPRAGHGEQNGNQQRRDA